MTLESSSHLGYYVHVGAILLGASDPLLRTQKDLVMTPHMIISTTYYYFFQSDFMSTIYRVDIGRHLLNICVWLQLLTILLFS